MQAADGVKPLDLTDLSTPVFSAYTAQDGLSDEIWNAVGLDDQGFVWAGSASELARFDGYRWRLWHLPQARSLVRGIFGDGQGCLWVWFEREGMVCLRDGLWQADTVQRVPPGRLSRTPRAGGQPQLWAAGERGLFSLHGQQWQADEGQPALRDVVAVQQTSRMFGQPRQWAASLQSGLWYREVLPDGSSGHWQQSAELNPGGVPYSYLLRTEDGGHEELWLLIYGTGVLRIREDGMRSWSRASGELPTEAIYMAVSTQAADGARLLWIASRAGLLRIRGDEVKVFDRRHGLPSDAVRELALQRTADGSDVLWMATEGGVARGVLDATPWKTVSLLGVRENGVFGLLVEPDGLGGERLWVGSAKEGLALLQQGVWRNLRPPDGDLPSVRRIWVLRGPDGQPWRLLSVTGGGLLRISDDLQFSKVPVPWQAAPGQAVNDGIAREHQGASELWFGTVLEGIYRLREGRWQQFIADGVQQPWAVTALMEQIDAQGRSWLWAASNQGIARFDGQRWELVKLLDRDGGYRSLTLILEGRRQVLWAASNRDGVVRVDISAPQQPALMDPAMVPAAPDPVVYSVLQDSVGRIYVCTNNGVQQLTPLLEGGYREQVFRRRDGLVHDECNTNAQMIDHQDRYWVGTLGGLSLYDPSIQPGPRRGHAKPLYFTRVLVDGEEQAVQGPLQLAAGSRELRVDYTLLSGQRERESTYRSWLEGYEPEFTAWTSEHHRSFTRLPPGTYHLRVQARDAGMVSSAAELEIRVAALWWQRGEVQVLGALAVLLGMVALARLHSRTLRRRQRLLEQEVQARTHQLHEANLRLVDLSYRDPLTGVANRRRLMEVLQDELQRAAHQQLPLGLIVIDVDHFKQYNDCHGHLAGDRALQAVATVLSSAVRQHDLLARHGGEEFACLLRDAGRTQVLEVAERMRTAVAALGPLALGDDHSGITISAGAISCEPRRSTTADQVLASADAALYEAKRGGRNRVVG